MLKANQICTIECVYDAVGYAYFRGLQVALEACNFGKLKKLILPVSCCMGADYSESQSCLWILRLPVNMSLKLYTGTYSKLGVSMVNEVIHQIDTM